MFGLRRARAAIFSRQAYGEVVLKDLITIDGTQYSNWGPDIFQEMRAGGVTAVNVTLVYWENARETLSNLGRWNRAFETHDSLIMPIRRIEDIETAQKTGRVGIMFGLQNASPIEDDISLIEIFGQLGVRTMQLTYNNQSLLAAGCYESHDAGVTRFGKVVIQEMNRVGMVVDMSHSAERSTLEAIDLSSKPIVISHANPYSFHPSKRNKSDAVLKALAERGGLLGLSLYPYHLKNESACTLDDFVEMTMRAIDLMGIDHIGLGSDLCQNQPYSILEWMRNGRWTKTTDYGEGSAGTPQWPAAPDWFGSSADFPNLVKGFEQHGLDSQSIRKVMGLNWYRLLADAEQSTGLQRESAAIAEYQ